MNASCWSLTVAIEAGRAAWIGRRGIGLYQQCSGCSSSRLATCDVSQDPTFPLVALRPPPRHAASPQGRSPAIGRMVPAIRIASALGVYAVSSTASQPETRVSAGSVCAKGASWEHPCDGDHQPMMERSDRVGNVTLGSDRRRRGVGNYREWQVF
jgi:hypothetical protein